MCWISTTAEKKTAEKDLFVFKMLIDTSHRRPDTLLSPVYRYFYLIGKEYRLQDPLKLDGCWQLKVYEPISLSQIKLLNTMKS